MNDVVLLQIINSGFWFVLFFITVSLFRNEIRKLLRSLGSFKVAGSSFDFNDPKETMKSYILLAETLIDILSNAEKIDDIKKLLVFSQVEKLADFATTYTQEVPLEAWNEEMLRNITYLLLRFDRFIQSIALTERLLAERPNDSDLLNLRSLAMINSRLPEQVAIATPILADLVDRYPENSAFRHNYALAESLSDNHEVAINEMQKIIETSYIYNNRYILQDELFHKTRDAKPNEFKKLTDFLKKRLETPKVR